MTPTQKRPFDVYLPGTKEKAPQLIATIEVEVENRFGEDFLTQESRQRIENLRASHMGLMSGKDIKTMRKRLNLSQKELTELLQCGEKSLSRWENGHGFPTGIVNTMLRLLDEGYLAKESLLAVHGQRKKEPWLTKLRGSLPERKRPLSYGNPGPLPESTSPKNGEILDFNQAA